MKNTICFIVFLGRRGLSMDNPPLRHILGRLTNHFSVYAVVRGCVGLPRKNPGAPKPIIV